jgi:CheY-like chemotaxis protein
MRVPADRAGVADAVAVPTAVIPPEQIRPARTNRVLVIDDDATVRDLMRRYLSREGFDVVTAAGGREGLEFARELHPSVITLDVFMPDMDGWSVLQAIKQDAELSRIPVVMMTISDEKQKGITLGASGYLTKPVDRAQLAQLLDRFKTAMPRALVVEDNLTDRDMMRRLLVGEGWEVIVASNGREALDRLKSEDHNLILLDLMMPEMDGFEFLAEFRKTPKFASTPVIVVTAADLSLEDRRRLDGGVEHILQKAAPSREDFLRQIRDLIGRYAVVAEFSAVDG